MTKFKKAEFLSNSITYFDEKGNMYVDDGGMLCGFVYIADNMGNIGIYARK